MKGKYPLEALVKVRQRAVDERVREVAERVRLAERAAAQARAAREQRASAEAQARVVNEAERHRLELGEARVADLMRGADWDRAEAERIAALSRREAQAREASQAEQREERAARARLASADAEAKAVGEHRERWQREREREREAEAEDNAADAWLSRRTRKDGR